MLVGLAPVLPDDLLARMPNLRWLHALTTGVDNLLGSAALPPGVVLTNSGGFHGPQMSELAILLMLSLLRRFPRMLDDQRAGRWNRWPQPLLEGRGVCILGLGAIAEALALRCNAFGMRVTGVSDGRAAVAGFARVYPRRALALAAAEADFLVVVVPYSPATHHIVDDRILSAMRPGAFLINIARGGCVDEDALLRHLAPGRLGGAGLDVFAVEPLPPDHPFRSLPHVIATPHVGGMSDSYVEQVLPVVLDRFAEHAAGGVAALSGAIPRPTGPERSAP